jgi:MFS family permease
MVNKGVNRLRRTKHRFFYGYIIVAIAFIIHLISFSLYDSFGVFVNPLGNEFGWTRAMISGAYSLSFVLMGVMAIIMGILIDRRGPRMALTICGLCFGLGFILMSQTQTQWQLYLFYGAIVGIGMSGIWAPLLSLLARWFKERRGLITGIVIAGGGIGALAGPPVITRLIEISDWRTAFLILGSTALVIIVLAAQFLKRDPALSGQSPYVSNEGKEQALESEISGFSLKEASATMQFWLVFSMLFCLAFFTFSVMVHIVPHAIDLEIQALTASSILAIIGGTSIIGNFVMGRVCDRIGPRYVFIISFILMAASLFWLAYAGELWGLYLFAVIFGFNHGGNATAQTPIIARLFGLSAVGSIFGAASFGFTIGGAMGPILTGYIYDVTLSYQLAFLVCGAVGVVGFILTAMLRPTKGLGGTI